MKRLGQSAVTTGAGTRLYDVPTGYKCNVQDILICNTTAGALTFSIHFVPSGGATGTGNAIFYTAPIAAYTTVHWEGSQVLNSGDFIQGVGSAAGVTVTISGDEYRDKV